MNTMLKLSKQFAKRDITQSEYRTKRRELINDMLSGKHVERSLITKVPLAQQAGSLDATIPPPTSQTTAQKIPSPNKKKRFGLLFWLALLFAGAVTAGYVYRTQLINVAHKHAPELVELAQTYALLPPVEKSE